MRIPRGIDGGINRRSLLGGPRIRARLIIFFVGALTTTEDAWLRLPERCIDVSYKTPGEILLRLILKQHGDLISKVRQDFLGNGKELLLYFKEVGEMIDDGVRRKQVSPRPVQERFDSSSRISKQLREGKVDDAASL